MLAQAAGRARREDLSLAPTSVDACFIYPWPGNERELENAMERAAGSSPGPIVEPISLPRRCGSASPRRAASTG